MGGLEFGRGFCANALVRFVLKEFLRGLAVHQFRLLLGIRLRSIWGGWAVFVGCRSKCALSAKSDNSFSTKVSTPSRAQLGDAKRNFLPVFGAAHWWTDKWWP